MNKMFFAILMTFAVNASADVQFGNREGVTEATLIKADYDGLTAYVSYKYGSNNEVKVLTLGTEYVTGTNGQSETVYVYSVWSKGGDLLVKNRVSLNAYNRMVASLKILNQASETITDANGSTRYNTKCPIAIRVSNEDFKLLSFNPTCSELPY